MKKASAVILAILFVWMSVKIGLCQAFLFYAGAMFILIMVVICVYAWHYHRQDDREKWEDEP